MLPLYRRSTRFWCSATLVLFLGVTLAGCRSAATDPALATFPDDVLVKPLPNALTFFAFGDWGVYGLGDQTLVASRIAIAAHSLTIERSC